MKLKTDEIEDPLQAQADDPEFQRKLASFRERFDRQIVIHRSELDIWIKQRSTKWDTAITSVLLETAIDRLIDVHRDTTDAKWFLDKCFERCAAKYRKSLQ